MTMKHSANLLRDEIPLMENDSWTSCNTHMKAWLLQEEPSLPTRLTNGPLTITKGIDAPQHVELCSIAHWASSESLTACPLKEEKIAVTDNYPWTSSNELNAWLFQEEESIVNSKFSEPLTTKAIEEWFLQETKPCPMRGPVARASCDGRRVRTASNHDHYSAPDKKRKCYSEQGEPVTRPLSCPPPQIPEPAPPTFTSKYMFKLLVGPICEFDMPETVVEGTISASKFSWT
jgi:hypothetical protein